ncbi:DUF6652 family protein [Anaerofustis stercorihominis]|uniref:DUF6652 family protein n=1 Tax=Anaerofustis stercorihominis TaxID=214853 RepID=UPI0011070722|nr:DUF6652 family protein [Anaerofustis stercorihominis]
MKKRIILPLLLICWPYMLLLMFALPDEDTRLFILFQYLIFTVIVYAANIINAYMLKEENDFYTLAFWNMTIKLIHIPFFVTMFIVGMIFIMAMVVPALLLASPIICLILACMNYILIMVSSSYGIKAVLKMKKENILSNKEATIHIIMHLIFILDVISSIIIFNKARKEYKKR